MLARTRSHYLSINHNREVISKYYQWIEDKLIQTTIADHRKISIDRVLALHLIVINNSYETTYNIVKDWLVACNSVERLKTFHR